MIGSAGQQAAQIVDPLPHLHIHGTLIGREAELAELFDQLDRQQWLTLVGVGGCGKTTLALHVAHRQRDQFTHGACWVALDAVNDPLLVPQAIATALGVEVRSTNTVEDAILTALADQHLLLVLDNCEHVLEVCRHLCEAIIEHAPRVTILATSRSALGSSSEMHWATPLLIQKDAIALFLDRAQGHLASTELTQSHELIAEICQRVDRLPLAIELAAARTTMLSLVQLHDHLTQALDVSAVTRFFKANRHDTMRATGVDIAANWIAQGRVRAAAEGLDAKFEVGDAEQLPYPDASFDTVVSMVGAIFAPQPNRVAAELTRVCRPGGRILMVNWTPQGFVGQMFKTIGKHVPPPGGVPSAMLWGDEATVRERFSKGVKDLTLTRHMYPSWHYPFGVPEVVEFFRQNYGPITRAFTSPRPAS